jgi:hypothetical protein
MKTKREEITHWERLGRKSWRIETSVLEHWVNYYFSKVNDETYWLKLVSE